MYLKWKRNMAANGMKIGQQIITGNLYKRSIEDKNAIEMTIS